jgi:hypothetical protein
VELETIANLGPHLPGFLFSLYRVEGERHLEKLQKPVVMKLPTIYTAVLASVCLSQPTTTNVTLVERGHTMNIRDCVLKGKPWGFVCCAHSWGLTGMHCLFYSHPELRLPELGKCEPYSYRYNHGPFCAVEYKNENGSPTKGGLFPQQNFKTKKLSKGTSNWGRYSSEGKRVMAVAINGGLEYEPTDLTRRDHNRGGPYPDFHAHVPNGRRIGDIKFWTPFRVRETLYGRTPLEKECYHECRRTSEIQNGQLRCIDYCWGNANHNETYASKTGYLYGWTAWERACWFECNKTFDGDREGQDACKKRCKDKGVADILGWRSGNAVDGEME